LSEFPEINLARRLVEREKLKPPVNIFELAEHFAGVEEKNFPVDVDGVSLNLKQSGKKPRIIINNNRSASRKRFTLAHELGHVIIPWHTGTIVDEVDIVGEDDNQGYWRLESEANRFASELLMPTPWVADKLQKFPEPLEATSRVARRAEVSFQAATLKVLNCLASGYIFAQIENGVVIASGRSFGTLANPPRVGSAVDPETVFPWSPPRWQRRIGESCVYWWQFRGVDALPDGNSQDWRELLNEIIGDIKVPHDDVHKFKSKLNGIIAYANANVRKNRTAEKIFEACLQRLHSQVPESPLIRKVVTHPKFEEFLGAKVSSMLVD
jgi:hypothetical protein